jgi:hypothetical protein
MDDRSQIAGLRLAGCELRREKKKKRSVQDGRQAIVKYSLDLVHRLRREGGKLPSAPAARFGER